MVGNPTNITDGLNAANNRTYGYQDFQYFLTQGDGPWGTQAWTYYRIGNRLTETKGAITDSYSYLPNGSTGNTALLDEITLGVGGIREYAYGPAGHLERVTNPGNEILFSTDAAGRQMLGQGTFSWIAQATPGAEVERLLGNPSSKK